MFLDVRELEFFSLNEYFIFEFFISEICEISLCISNKVLVVSYIFGTLLPVFDLSVRLNRFPIER